MIKVFSFFMFFDVLTRFFDFFQKIQLSCWFLHYSNQCDWLHLSSYILEDFYFFLSLYILLYSENTISHAGFYSIQSNVTDSIGWVISSKTSFIYQYKCIRCLYFLLLVNDDSGAFISLIILRFSLWMIGRDMTLTWWSGIIWSLAEERSIWQIIYFNGRVSL